MQNVCDMKAGFAESPVRERNSDDEAWENERLGQCVLVAKRINAYGSGSFDMCAGKQYDDFADATFGSESLKEPCGCSGVSIMSERMLGARNAGPEQAQPLCALSAFVASCTGGFKEAYNSDKTDENFGRKLLAPDVKGCFCKAYNQCLEGNRAKNYLQIGGEGGSEG